MSQSGIILLRSSTAHPWTNNDQSSDGIVESIPKGKVSKDSAKQNIESALPQVTVLTPADGKAYEDSLHRWCENAETKAKFVVLPKSADEVSKAVCFAKSNNLEIAIKCGGHSAFGASSSEGLVVDLANLNAVSVDASKQRITVGGGTLWENVNKAAAAHGLATVGATVDHTGVGGVTVGGGYGWLSAKYGLTIDILEEAQVVLASGEIVDCSETQNTDLFWAIRGGGSNFGVVTSFTFRAFPQTNPVWSGFLLFPPSKLESLFAAASVWAQSAGEDESAHLFMACQQPESKPCIAVIPFYNGCAEEGKKKFAAFYDVGPVTDMTHEMPYETVNSIQNPMATHGGRKLFNSTAFTSLEPVRFHRVFEAYEALTAELPETAGSAVVVELHPYDKVASVPTSATAFGNRGKWYNVNFAMRWEDAALDSRMRAWSTEQVEQLRSQERKEMNVELASKHGYANYGLGNELASDVFGENYERLTDLKAKYDPENVFHKWFPITPKEV